MEILDDIKFTLDAERLLAEAYVEAGSKDADELCALIELARSVGRPKAVYTVGFIGERDSDSVVVDQIRFGSRTLAHNLEDVERVFPYVATCGDELDRAFSGHGDMLKQYWWDMIKSQLLETANEHIRAHLHRKYKLGGTAAMHPGSADTSVWPIEQQRGLFKVLGDVEGAIAVRLTDSSLMIPNKTTSGIIFENESDYRSCEVCHRENCPSRHAPFNEQLWATVRQNSDKDD